MLDASWVELRKIVAPELVFGEGALSLAGRYAKNLGAKKVLVVAGTNMIRAGWAEKVATSLEVEGLPYSTFSRVSPNPRAEEVMEGAAVYKREGCDVIVAVGGGSSTDCAKGIGIVSVNRKNILEFAGVDLIPIPGPPLICVPTTNSGADVSQFAIITDTREKNKISIVSKTLVPDTSLLDPLTSTTMPDDLTVYTGLDAFSQAIEAYVSNASSHITDLYALDAAELLYHHIVFARNEPKNTCHRASMVLGSLEAGLAFSNASLGLVHSMAHTLGGLTDAPHGLCCSILLPHVVKFNYDAAPERYDAIGGIMGLNLESQEPGSKKKAIVNAIETLKNDTGIRVTMGDLGVNSGDIRELARKTMDDACIVTNPRPVRLEDAIGIFHEAL